MDLRGRKVVSTEPIDV